MSENPELKAIFFDIDGTLFSTSEFAARARHAAVDAMIGAGLRLEHDELYAELSEVIREFSSNHDSHFDKLLVRLPRRVTKGLNAAMVIAAGVVAYHETKSRQLEPYEDAVEALRRLAQTDLLLGVITEGLAVKQAEKLVRLRLADFFAPQAIFISHQLGISKPNTKLYQRACGDLNLKPSSCMYIGDNPLTDIDPANKVGMITVRIKRDEKFLRSSGETEAQHEIQNYWDLLELLRSDYGVAVSEVLEGDGA